MESKMEQKRQKIPESYLALDLETTGLNDKQDKIIEIGAIRMENGVETGRFSKLIQPGCEIGTQTEYLTNITNEMVKDAPYIEMVLPEFLAFEKGLPLLGHNIMFDYRFLKRAAVRFGYSYEREGMDTLMLSRRFCTSLERKNLDAVCQFLNIPLKQHHRAISDARAAADIYEILKKSYQTQEPEAFVPKPLIYQVKKEQFLTKHQKEYLNDLIKCNRIEHTVDIDRLTRAEASRLTDQWIRQYGKLAPEQKSWKKSKGGFE